MSNAHQIEERAALWVLRREEPSWSEADDAELDAWLAESDAHKAAYWRLDHGWRQADRIASLGAPDWGRAPGFARLPSWSGPLAIAASLLLVFTLVVLQGRGLPFGGEPRVAAMEFETPVGGHKVVKLPDGSRVELNTDTAIKASVDEATRTVWLDHGEAFFDVAKRSGRKFVIHAGSRTISVLGTKFSVRHDGREVVVAVLEGRVRVEDSPGAGPDREATVSAGDVAVATDRTTLVTNSAEAVQQELAWRMGRLVFDEVTLASAVEQFNRYNRKQLVMSDAHAAQLRVSGSFLARNVDDFARLLQRSYGLDVDEGGGKIVLSTRRMASRDAAKPSRADLALARGRSVVEKAIDTCGHRGGDCALIPLSPPAREVQVASAANVKAIRDERNWSVLHKLYPPRALAAGEEGLVGFTVKIDGRGNPTACRITHTSGHPLLDLETCKLILVHASFKRPTGLSPSQQRSYDGVVNWKLPTTPRTAVPATPKPIAEASAPEELICKTLTKIGSIAATERKCMTKSEWQRASDEYRTVWQELRGTKN